MAREQYGNTWWGKQWLESLSKIDYSNRIPRGKSYARRGMVADIEIKKATIHTKVRGSRPTPYKVTLSMGSLNNSIIEKLLDDVMEYPTIVSKLLNGKMDPQLLSLASKHGINIFPESSRDMEMYCSCPDWAVPCKHLAASIYKVCSDIDNNPFILFEFRGIDLPELLAKRNINIYELQNQSVLKKKDFFEENLVDASLSLSDKITIPDYSRLKDEREPLLALLEEEPSFYNMGSFKKNYTELLKKIQKAAQRLLDEKVSLKKYYPGETDEERFRELTIKLESDILNFEGISPGQIWEYDDRTLDLSPASVRYYHEVYQLAVHALANGLFIPTLIESDPEEYQVLWSPAMLNDHLKDIVKEMDHPSGILIDKERIANGFLTLTLVITDLVHKISDDLSLVDDRYLKLFYSKNKERFDGLSESSIPNAISRWLRLFTFDLGEYFPVLKVEDEGDNFTVDIQIDKKSSELKAPLDFQDFIRTIKDESSLFDFYKDLDLLSSYIPGISNYINSKGKEILKYSELEFPDFLFNIQPIMKLLGIKVVMSKALKELIRPKPSVSMSSSSSAESSGLLGLSQLLQFDWRISLGKEVVSPQAFNKLFIEAEKIIRYKGQYIYISEKDFIRLQKDISQQSKISNIELLSIALSEEYHGASIQITSEVQDLIKSLTEYDVIDQPQSLKAVFRPYQQRGYSWMVKNAKVGVGSIIADDMGLGKTLQVIALLAYLSENGQVRNDRQGIIIVPTSLIPNWEAEFSKFAPSLQISTYYGPNRIIEDIKDAQIILTSYGTVRSDITELKKLKWAAVIIDEAQNIKNPTAQQTKAIKSLKADHFVAMSGTPVENRLMDYWSVMDFVNKGLLGNRTYFTKEFDKPISKAHNQQALERFKKITAPFIIRRMKTDKSIISDLPDKIIQDTFAILTPIQSALYEKVVAEALRLIKTEDQKEDSSLFKRQGLVLQMILSLKQICNHPSQWLKDGKNGIEDSGKLRLLLDTMSAIIEGRDKALIFTQFRGMGDILVDALHRELGIESLWLHGGVSLAKRKKMVDQFQNESHQKVMILSLKAGGTGLNLTAANHVIHYDLWWNPAVEMQATDRAFRIGQKKNVFVHRLITQHTFEEKINALINSKKDLANMTVSSGENWIGKMSNKELQEVFKID